ncbi:MAG: GNAT family N-acetyltransferase [Vulcanimicrobiaceae bacterium]
MAWIRSLGRDDIGFCFELAKAEGWNSGRYDAVPFFAADPEGFFVALDDDGNKLGCIAAVRYETFGYIGMFLVRPEFRGRGIGAELFDAALRHLGGLPIALDAVQSQEARYARHGFERAYTTFPYSTGERDARDRFASGIALERLRVLDDDVVAYDRECFGSARAAFLQAWVAQPDVVALVARSLSTREIVGYGVGREAREGTKVGPLFASRLDIAAILFDTIAQRTRPPWRLDVPEPNFPAIALTDERGLTRGAPNVRMWRGAPPKTELQRIYGITSFELG